MLKSYRTLLAPGEDTLIIKKSRFIGYATPVSSEEEALQFIAGLQKKHWDATHNCYAYVCGPHDEIQKANDDGEPSGTAGKPILEVIKKEELHNVAVVVTRYFGGIMLGAGGLIRAYSAGCGAGLQAAQIVTRILFQEIAIEIDYTWYGKIENELHAGGWHIDRVEYLDRVTVYALCPVDDTEALHQKLINATNGQALLTNTDQRYLFERDGKLVQ
ncbi:YigZ family protein [Tumebacillus permanentifrigoris]|uniref:Putative YigZ family protein n=1 Tax=Tumebacillus permanentifrigoris TaxID=378543 RepID=A0A316DES4_9BACL|nr:YigZ family protein [Tumebacillus permanentifrigoris]PWK16236.1 putative YigZ family protein [Tumebacillus permanentifrigoris]